MHQIILLFAAPAFELFLTPNGIADVAVFLIIDQSIELVLLDKRIFLGVSMPSKSTVQAVSNADIKHDPTSVGQHVYVESHRAFVRSLDFARDDTF